MKRGKIDKKKEIKKIRSKKIKNLITNKRTRGWESDLWKEMYSVLRLLGKKYKNFREKQNIKKQKEEQIRLKEQEQQKLQEQEQQKLQEQEERELQKKQKLKEEKEKRLKAQEEQILEEKKIKEEQQEQKRQEQIYKERVARGDQERLKQLEKVSQLRQEEKRLKEERELQKEQKFKEKEKQRLEEEQRPKKEGKRQRLSGKIKWFNSAKGYGFIEREGEEKDIFVHFSAVKESGLKYLEEGEQLMFEIKNSEKGPSAINLQKMTDLQEAPFLKLVKKN
jgi:CspA family cold shock protein